MQTRHEVEQTNLVALEPDVSRHDAVVQTLARHMPLLMKTFQSVPVCQPLS